MASKEQRLVDELRPYVIGRESWHDQTLGLWIEAYFPDDAGQNKESR